MLALAGRADAAPKHGVAMHGVPALGPGFTHLPYANPNAPKGGRLVLGEAGSFDSLNPYVLRGTAPWAIGAHTVESLMARSYAEPFTLYGLLAESIEMPPDRSWVAFTLRKGARFSDGSPVTVADVIWSFRTLGTEGHPRYRNVWSAIASIRATGPRTVRIDLAVRNRELPLILGLRPVLKKAQFAGRDFARSGQEVVIGSGPYVVDRFERGRFIEFRRNPDWWGRDLAINRGLNNFDRVRYEFFRNGDVLWEAVRTGAVSIFTDSDPVRWTTGYDFDAIRDGRAIRGEIANDRPTGMHGLVFNTRRPIFADRRVREALALSFDWEFVNARLYRGAYRRIRSYFGGSALGFSGPAGPAERAILEPFADRLPQGILEAGWRPPVSNGTGRDRRNLRRASRLLSAAGWKVRGGVRRNAKGTPMAFEILTASDEQQRLADLWRRALKPLGIEVTVRLIDGAQFQLRRRSYDYDMIVNRWAMSLSPGVEQEFYFGSEGRTREGTRNYMGVADPAVDAAIRAIVTADDPARFRAAVRALDRVLTSGIYVIPFGVLPAERIVWQKGFHRPGTRSLYGWWGWWSGAALWWYAE